MTTALLADGVLATDQLVYDDAGTQIEHLTKIFITDDETMAFCALGTYPPPGVMRQRADVLHDLIIAIYHGESVTLSDRLKTQLDCESTLYLILTHDSAYFIENDGTITEKGHARSAGYGTGGILALMAYRHGLGHKEAIAFAGTFGELQSKTGDLVRAEKLKPITIQESVE